MKLSPLNHNDLMATIALSREAQWRSQEQWQTFAGKVLLPGLSHVMHDEGRIMCCFGVFPEWPGRALAWSIITKSARPREIVSGVKVCAEWFSQIQLNPQFRRLEMMMSAGHAWCDGYTKALGFTLEGRCVAFGQDGSDFLMYARIATLNLNECPNAN